MITIILRISLPVQEKPLRANFNALIIHKKDFNNREYLNKKTETNSKDLNQLLTVNRLQNYLINDYYIQGESLRR